MKISIITINLNNFHGLLKTIDSVLSQERSLYEWIIIDGGSTDGSRELIEQNQYNIDYWVSESDRGIYNAMNKGINVAKGEYLLFLNSGDYLKNDCLQSVVPMLRGEIMVGRVESESSGKLSYQYEDQSFSFSQLYYYSFPHQASFIKRELFIKYGMYDERYKIASDWSFFLKVLLREDINIHFISDVISVVEDNGISQTHKLLFEAERKIILGETIPSYLVEDLEYSLSLHELKKSRIAKKLYSILYRLFCHFFII